MCESSRTFFQIWLTYLVRTHFEQKDKIITAPMQIQPEPSYPDPPVGLEHGKPL